MIIRHRKLINDYLRETQPTSNASWWWMGAIVGVWILWAIL